MTEKDLLIYPMRSAVERSMENFVSSANSIGGKNFVYSLTSEYLGSSLHINAVITDVSTNSMVRNWNSQGVIDCVLLDELSIWRELLEIMLKDLFRSTITPDVKYPIF